MNRTHTSSNWRLPPQPVFRTVARGPYLSGAPENQWRTAVGEWDPQDNENAVTVGREYERRT